VSPCLNIEGIKNSCSLAENLPTPSNLEVKYSIITVEAIMYCTTISQSKANTFSECKLKYLYRYVQRVPQDETNGDALHFGSYIHKILEEGVACTTLEELQEHAKEQKSKYKFGSSYTPKIDICLRNFLKFNAKLAEAGATEQVYEVTVKDDISVNGIIDRVIRGKDGGYLVIDYKTSKRQKTKFDLYQDDQLQGYCFAVHKLYETPIENIAVAHYYPLTDTLVSVNYSNSQIAAYLRKKIDEVWKIRKSKKVDMCPMQNQYCNWCGYKYVCPLFNPQDVVTKRLDEIKNQTKADQSQK